MISNNILYANSFSEKQSNQNHQYQISPVLEDVQMAGIDIELGAFSIMDLKTDRRIEKILLMQKKIAKEKEEI